MNRFSFTLLCLALSLIASACIKTEVLALNKGDKGQVVKDPAKCVGLGGTLTPVKGSAPGAGQFTQKCCEPLTAVSDPTDAANGAAPGKVICALCGNGVCDGKFENKFNCPQDCK